MTHMTFFLGEWGITTDFAELEIEYRSMRGLNVDNLNLYYEKM